MASEDEKRHHVTLDLEHQSPSLSPSHGEAGNTRLRQIKEEPSIYQDIATKATDALNSSYHALRHSLRGDALPGSRPDDVDENDTDNETRGRAAAVTPIGSERIAAPFAFRHTLAERAPLPQKHFSFDAGHQGELHGQNQHLIDNFSLFQRQRQIWKPTLPSVYTQDSISVVAVEAPELPQHDAELLEPLYPHLFHQPCIMFQPGTRKDTNEDCGGKTLSLKPELSQRDGVLSDTSFTNTIPAATRVGILLSGGPAPGGHNVISGLFDYLQRFHPGSELYGFMGGLDGLFQGKYRHVTDELMSGFRNQGGFDMLWSGRGRIHGEKDLSTAVQICQKLNLRGLVVVGGDGTLSNASILAEHFASHLPECIVVGVPKTIDGDLKNAWIETSFGFDTAAKTYSELIGNLCTDVTTGQQVYHFVRVMGRSASHLVVECALQTRPNLVFIGEEVEASNTTLPEIVHQLTDLILKRRDRGKVFGVILVPEGLIEAIPEMRTLITELNRIIETSGDKGSLTREDIKLQLTERSQRVWEYLPDTTQDQLLMDREATGYVQVAKIATERLLKVLTENELQRHEVSLAEVIIMPHYFGYADTCPTTQFIHFSYEGRCAPPSNFDANYCYSLGYTAGVLIAHQKMGYVTAVRHLQRSPTDWAPGGIPCPRLMAMNAAQNNNKPFPAVIRQLFDLKGDIYTVLCEAREVWKLDDYYRCPGPIQFDGPEATRANYSICIPTKAELLSGVSDSLVGEGSAISPKRPGALSPLQLHRLNDTPKVPDLCRDVYARAIPCAQYLPKDLFTQRQILLHYPYICNSNQFYLHEVIHDSNTSPVGAGLKIGVVFLSRQAPGVINIVWGMLERLKLVGGHCLGFYGSKGLCTGHYIEIQSSDLEFYVNQGGMELLGRTTTHSLLDETHREAARQTCIRCQLDGLVIVGSSLAMTEAALTAEHFLSKNCATSIIGVPATGSNNLMHELIETNIGFDTSSKVYASLIGNVLTDAASMPKYWHFVRLMGRQPSNEVLECALQTHPNFVIIAEEYGAANKTLGDVVSDIADVICRRAEMGKNFGAVLIPDGLLSHLPNMQALLNELTAITRQAVKLDDMKAFQAELDRVEEDTVNGPWVSKITPWSLALFKSLPKFIRRELTQVDMGEVTVMSFKNVLHVHVTTQMRFALIETELLLSQMVQQELESRKTQGRYNGKFSSVCHFFGYQGRSSMPSLFDAKLAFTYGHLAVICIESGLTGHCCTVRGLCGETKDWKLAAIPFNSMLMFTASQDESHPELSAKHNELPIIPSAEVNLNGKAYRWMRIAVGQWQLQDRFCNPGPIQFHGPTANFCHRTLYEEQEEYFHMLRHVQLYSTILKDTCSFGVDEQFLKVVFSNLHSLLCLRYHPDDIVSFLPPLTDVQKYEEWQTSSGRRRQVSASAETAPDLPQTAHSSSTLRKYRSLIGNLVAKRLHSAERCMPPQHPDNDTRSPPVSPPPVPQGPLERLTTKEYPSFKNAQ